MLVNVRILGINIFLLYSCLPPENFLPFQQCLWKKVLILRLHPLASVPHACLIVARLVCSRTYSMKQGVIKIANIRKYFLISPAQVFANYLVEQTVCFPSMTNLSKGMSKNLRWGSVRVFFKGHLKLNWPTRDCQVNAKISLLFVPGKNKLWFASENFSWRNKV